MLQAEAPRLHLERARDCKGGSTTAWCTDYWGGGVPDPRVVVGRVKEVK